MQGLRNETGKGAEKGLNTSRKAQEIFPKRKFEKPAEGKRNPEGKLKIPTKERKKRPASRWEERGRNHRVPRGARQAQ